MRKWITPVSLSVSLVLAALACRLVVQRSAQESAPMTDRQAVATTSATDALVTPRVVDFSARKPEAAVGPSGPAAATVASTSLPAVRRDREAGKLSVPEAVPDAERQQTEHLDFAASATQLSGPVVLSPAPGAAPLGMGSLRAQTPSETPPALRTAPSPTPSMPLAFQDANPAVAKLNDTQQPAIAQLRQQFVSDIGGPDADSSAPEYLNRWRNAQPASDTQFRGFFGQKAFLDANLAAGQQDTAQNQAGN